MNNILKYLRVSINLIENLNLDLSNLNILTECASNAYAFTPIISCLAGAKSVIVVGSDTRYGKYEDNKSNIIKICNMSGLDISKLIFVRRNKLDKIDLSNIDIITNSGQLRPITESLITKLKRTAVIPLMWEPWEFRKEDLNIVACQKKNIPVIGTNENFSEISMYGYNPLIVIKLLFDLGLEGYNNNIVLLGGGKSGNAAYQGLKKIGFKILWFTSSGEKDSYKYEELQKIYNCEHVDAIVNYEHENPNIIIGKKSILDLKKIKTFFPYISYGHITGSVKQSELDKYKVNYLPRKILPFGYMSYETVNLGYRPALELATAGLKVGEIAARSRINGESAELAIKRTIEHGIGQDFKGGFFNFRIK